jgi:hypothetical protein
MAHRNTSRSLSAVALALYLAAVVETTPPASAAHLPRLLVLDDALIGLDLGHRLPLLDLLKSDDFADWQILLMTYAAARFDMASDHLPKDKWANRRT